MFFFKRFRPLCSQSLASASPGRKITVLSLVMQPSYHPGNSSDHQKFLLGSFTESPPFVTGGNTDQVFEEFHPPARNEIKVTLQFQTELADQMCRIKSEYSFFELETETILCQPKRVLRASGLVFWMKILLQFTYIKIHLLR